MCWSTANKKNTEARTARKDIPVFKVAYADENGEACRPYYAWFAEKLKFLPEQSSRLTNRYEKGVTYRPSGFDTPFLTEGGYYVASEGFHSYSPECEVEVKAEESGMAQGKVAVYSVRGGYVNDLLGWYAHERLCVMRCSIPKGSRYCVNEFGEYVSDAIRVESFEPLPVKPIQKA